MNSIPFTENVQFQHELMSEVYRIAMDNAGLFIQMRLADKLEDTKQATDMVLDMSNSAKVAVRIRRYQTVNRTGKVYRDFTIRAQNKGLKTELDKLREGWCDWYIYAWESANKRLDEYVIINLHTVRTSGLLSRKYPVIPNKVDGKPDGTGFIGIQLQPLINCGALYSGHVFMEGYWRSWGKASPALTVDMPAHLLRKAG